MIFPATLRQWRETRYCTDGGICVRIGARSAGADAWLAAHGARAGGFITAWNPGARRHPEGWNQRRQGVLVAALRRYPISPGVGQGRLWAEAHVLVAADPCRLAVLARRFRQAGLVVLRRRQQARLCVLA